MPYRRRYRRRRRRRPQRYKRPWWMRAVTANARTIAKMINSEPKIHTRTLNITPSSAGVINYISNVAQGDTNATRDGNQIMVNDFLTRFTTSMHATATVTFVRFIIFKDIQSNGVLPTVAELLRGASVTSALNIVNGRRFTVLYDKLYSMDDIKSHSSQAKVFRNLGSLKIRYLDSTANQAGAGTNALYVCAVSSEATNTPTIAFDFRLRFRDN